LNGGHFFGLNAELLARLIQEVGNASASGVKQAFALVGNRLGVSRGACCVARAVYPFTDAFASTDGCIAKPSTEYKY